jgi:hypothetical protein
VPADEVMLGPGLADQEETHHEADDARQELEQGHFQLAVGGKGRARGRDRFRRVRQSLAM